MAEIACQTIAPARPNIWKADMQAINSAASAENGEIDSRASVQEAWTLFRQLYNRVTQPYMPWTVPKKKKHDRPWMGRDIRRLLRQKKKCWDVAIRLGTAGTMERYRSVRNKCITKIRESQRKYEMQLAQPELKQPKRMFSYINYIARMHYWIPNLIKEGSESEMIEEDQEEAEAMADYFGAVFNQEPPLDKEPDQNTESTNHLLTVNFDQDDVLKALITLNMEKGKTSKNMLGIPIILQQVVSSLTLLTGPASKANPSGGRIIEARLESSDSSLNTYISVKLRQAHSSTQSVKGTAPKWNEEFIFETERMDGGLLIELHSKGLLKDKLLGVVWLPLNKILHSNKFGDLRNVYPIHLQRLLQISSSSVS
ncbi:unnamed protein product [Schistosoma mattheei]|uniref:Uncharacterized protein n=1 Tax=Schistosoma mattheei TaxID=31246 RepID=A0A183NXC1_9TREM|nr:unnamed protein product [Schistosoma mattheei]